MTVQDQATTPTFESLNPANGEVVGTHPIHDDAAVRAAVESSAFRLHA